jgi:hypothetical protein
MIDLLLPILDFAFDFWLFFLLAGAVNWRNARRNILYAWILWAVIRVVLFFSPEPIPTSMLIPEPLSTRLFFLAGILLLVGWAAWEYLRRYQMRRKASHLNSRDLLDLPPGELEEMTAELFRKLGHRARRTRASGDHGVDVVVDAKNGQRWVVQCKRWRKQVGEPIVRDFYGTMQHEKAAQGAIVATSGFTPQAAEWAKGKPLHLYDGEEFMKLWSRAGSQQTNARKQA